MKKVDCKNPEAVVKRAFFLAYQACERETGMGVFRARSGVTEDQVWKTSRMPATTHVLRTLAQVMPTEITSSDAW